MTRACLVLTVLLGTLGATLMMANPAQCQISSDYYRFGPIYSNVGPFVDGCMEAHEDETQTNPSEDGAKAQDELDLRGRAVVAILEDPLEDVADDVADVDESREDAPSECPYDAYYEDCECYDGYEDAGCYSSDQADPEDEEAVDSYPEDTDGDDATSEYDDPCQDAYGDSYEPTEDVVEAETVGDPWDEADYGHDYDYGSEYGNSGDSEVSARQTEEDAWQPAADDEVPADEAISEEPADVMADDPEDDFSYDEYAEDHAYDDSYDYSYDDGEAAAESMNEEAAPEEPADAMNQYESYESYKYESDSYEYDDQYGYDEGCYDDVDDPQTSADESASDDVDDVAGEDEPYEAYDYEEAYYDTYDNGSDWGDDSQDAKSPEASESSVDPTSQYDDDYDYDYDYDYRDDCDDEDRCEQTNESSDSDQSVADQEVVEPVTEEPGTDVQDEYDGRYPYGYGYEYDYEYHEEYGDHGEAAGTDEAEVVESPVGGDDGARIAELAHQFVNAVVESEVADVVRAEASDLLHRVVTIVKQFDLEAIRGDLDRAVEMMIRQARYEAIKLSAANVFLFAFDFDQEEVGGWAPETLEETPWLVEDRIVNQSPVDDYDSATVEAAEDIPVSMFAPADHQTVLKLARRAVDKVAATWNAMTVEFERLAAENMADASGAESSATTQR